MVVSLLFINSLQAQNNLYKIKESKVSFTSDAPVELITAYSEELSGLLNISNNEFAFKINMNSFEGFNSALQKTHFKENYMETDKFPYAIFQGHIKEAVDFSKNATYTVNAKGAFNVHGVEKERTIKSTVSVTTGIINIKSEFSIMLEDYNIKIPSIVYQKVAEEIFVTVDIKMIPK